MVVDVVPLVSIDLVLGSNLPRTPASLDALQGGVRGWIEMVARSA